MNIIGTLILMFNPGRNNPNFLVPACILLFLGIWIEKGIGLIVPGSGAFALGRSGRLCAQLGGNLRYPGHTIARHLCRHHAGQTGPDY